jgi:hypothetical protein
MSGYSLRSKDAIGTGQCEENVNVVNRPPRQKRRHAVVRGKTLKSSAKAATPLLKDPPTQRQSQSSLPVPTARLANSLTEEELEAHLASLNCLRQSDIKKPTAPSEACALCGYGKLLFETPVYRCDGANCNDRPIPRDADFYGNNRYFLCTTCYDGEVPIPDAPVNRADLEKRKNNEVHEERWIKCSTCKLRVHQICGLFNSQQCSHDEDYDCPSCLKKKRAFSPPSPRPPEAEDLPPTALSEWLQNHLTQKLRDNKGHFAEEWAQSEVSQAASRSLSEPDTKLRYFLRICHWRRRPSVLNRAPRSLSGRWFPWSEN